MMSEALGRMQKSDLSCQSCRKRKVKCDRILPQCMVCSQSGQTCTYPLRTMKPGPKIGSLQRNKRPRFRDEISRKRSSASPYSFPRDANSAYSGSSEALHDGLEKESPNPADCSETNGANERRSSRLNIHDLSFILHPSHESTTQNNEQDPSPGSNESGKTGLCRQACAELRVSQPLMNQMIRVFFDNMVALNLFHEPTFAEKLSNISSLWELTALLAAMAAFASRFFDRTYDTSISDESQLPQTIHQPAYFLDHAFNYINKALIECEDEVPPLCVIQALIIATHCQLTRGVRGKAWRSLGLCRSLAYEANMHVLDSEAVASPDPQQWQLDEEKRRAFWAIWEMDVFASTIRRTPTAIDWNHMAVLLPVDNASWFSGNPASSCFMEIEPNQRWKTLQERGNRSAKAWFLVINSLMKTAQTTANPRGIAVARKSDQSWLGNRASTPKSISEIRQTLEALANAVRCFSLALPDRLLYRDQYLAFDAPVHRQVESQRQRDCDIYNIFVMMQLARLMVYRYDAFPPQSHRSETNGRDRSGDSDSRAASKDTENVALQQYYDAADRILKIVSQSCEEHIKHINPFLSSTIWLAAAVQLVHKHLTRPSANTSLIKSRFDVLYLTYKRCTLFWDTQTALQRNLESLEEQLEARQRVSHMRSRQHSPSASKRAMGEMEPNSKSSEQQDDQVNRHKKRQGSHTALPTTQPSCADDLPTTADSNEIISTQYLPDSPISPADFPLLAHEKMHITADKNARQTFNALASTEIIDPVTLAQPDREHITETYMMPPNPDFLDSMDLGNNYDDQALEWERLDFPASIHDIFAGWTSY